MAEFKFAVGNPGTKKTYKIEKKDSDAQAFFGMKVGQEFNGELIGLTGYKLKITGGSDYTGIPMRPEIGGSGKKKILLKTGAIGFKKRRYHNISSTEGAKKKLKQTYPGERRRKSVRGNTISEDTVQINCRVISAGKETPEKLLGLEIKTEETPAEAKTD
jgi:small subunit ribosomal protein S6e